MFDKIIECFERTKKEIKEIGGLRQQYSFWYSRTQEKRMNDGIERFVKVIDSDDYVPYTEMTCNTMPNGNFQDYIFVGFGYIDDVKTNKLLGNQPSNKGGTSG